ncbi:gp436 family protein [Lysobacter sp. CA199]|uniref:gp436 family protein n=1 Tax=Lysobacter sp. CA199 TaxID=3455608 RepID=UPI003F8D8391
MRYCTFADLQRAIPARTLVELSNDDPTADAPDIAIVEGKIEGAEELVDSYLRGRYVLPLAPVPTVVKDVTIHLARYELYARRPEGNDLPDAVVRTHKGAIDLLEEIRDGKVTIGHPDTQAATPEPGQTKVRARRQAFPQTLLDRY